MLEGAVGTPDELRNAARRRRIARVRSSSYDLMLRHRPCVGCGRLTRWIWLATMDHVCHREACEDAAQLR